MRGGNVLCSPGRAETPEIRKQAGEGEWEGEGGREGRREGERRESVMPNVSKF